MSSYSAEGFMLTAWGDPTSAESLLTEDPAPIGSNHGTPEAFIQWKGTDVCLDFYCPCGMQSHIDSYFAYALQCPACERIFDMPHTVQLKEREPVDQPKCPHGKTGPHVMRPTRTGGGPCPGPGGHGEEQR